MEEEIYVSSSSRHEIAMVNRNTLEVTGVTSVESFDSEEFLLNTEYGYLGIRGDELHIKNLDLAEGSVSIEGNFYEMSYLDDGMARSEKVKGMFGRLFR
ncbi:sporulation protein YabP [Mechercharimyces sp. CAU 1602]|uniref:sporulation protein YabP n=1 Tax=Mechercharimyces sp. CAU 1602 TaxID=2973933 RepID=UPI0021622324|nr:sporulation protein YabP [Mechercharimyces sp. CAU 1602]MCS1352387.1 sporulation protein YabP [Mechercharimyces sp. CAU 1602]